ncbi:MAG TPA: hypothetical protein VII09_04020 [Opitutaceae bacterium]
MKKTNITQTCLLTALTLGLALSASAQSTPPAAVATDPGPGLVGTNYSELSFGYQRQRGDPTDLRDYQFVSNGSVYREGALGADVNFTYDYLNGSANGFRDYRQEAMLGLTGFLLESWGKPFVTVDGGMAWEHSAGASRKGFAYTTTAGVEFQVLRDLALAPFIEYQAEPHLYNHGLPLANFPDHLVDSGVKATYRINRQWNASLTADVDQHSYRDWGLRVGASYHF